MLKSYNHKSLEEKIFAIILFLSIFSAFASILGNIFIGLPFYINIKWFFIILFSIISLKYLHNQTICFLYFLSIIFLFIPLGWLDAGGGSSSIGYLFLVSIAVCILFSDKKRLFLFISLILVFIALLTISRHHPQSVLFYSIRSYYYDTLLQVPVTLIISFIFLNIFANAYNKEKTILKKYSDELTITNEKLKKISTSDSLTGFYNRKEFFNQLQRYVQSNYEFCVLMLDIDNFKGVNDQYGHIIGDSVIMEICTTIREIFCPNSTFGRYGGDEFIIIINTNAKNSKKLCDLFLQSLHHNNHLGKFNVTVSGGLISYKENMDLLDLLKSVDEKLYQAKNLGKNQIYSI
ncbi:MAG: diguanylate cyclase [Eubacteriales bacterium]